MNYARCLLVLFVLGAASAVASDIGHEIADAVDVASYQHYLDDMLYTHYGDNRGRYGPEHDLARDAIAAEFARLGYEVEYEPVPFIEMYYNVVAVKRGRLAPDSYYLVGAHYDSADNPGADDDASGVAGLLELARVFADYDTGYSLVLVAFDLEITNLEGSQQSAALRRADDILGMIQLEMIAWDFGNYRMTIHAADSAASPALATELESAFKEYGGDLVGLIGTICSVSDEWSFGRAGFPACKLIERRFTNNPCANLPCDSVDEPDYINYAMASDAVRAVGGFLADRLMTFHRDDCNQDGVSDALQILQNPDLDCNGNGFLDECEPGGAQDCNQNGVSDLCDIFNGTSVDIDQNLIPDECQPQRHVPAEYGTIQAALDAAEPGDVIIVADDTYRGPGNIDLNFNGKALILRSENGPESCVIDCEGVSRGVQFLSGESKSSVISGFTITNGYASESGGAIDCHQSSPSILDCVITNCVAPDGAGIYCRAARPTIRDCELSANQATWWGGSIQFENGGGEVSNCWIHDNARNGISCGGARVAINACTIENNNGGLDGGGVYCYGADGTRIANCVISGNTVSQSGGGIRVEYTEDFHVTDCIISDNQAHFAGGGIDITGSGQVTIERNVIRNNDVDEDGGGIGVSGIGTGPVIIKNCALASNTAIDGGGVHGRFTTILIENCSFFQHLTESAGGAIYADTDSEILVSNSILCRNFPEEIKVQTSGAVDITYSCIHGGYEGVGNIDVDPLLVRDGTHLCAGSLCRNAGDPDSAAAGLVDIDGEPRVVDARVDIGCDEFIDGDADELPDWWETLYFQSPAAGDPAANSDGDAWTDLAEYVKNGNPFQPGITYYVDVAGDDAWDGLAPAWNGVHGPKATIRAALELTDRREPDQIVLAPGVYKHAGIDGDLLDFEGKPTMLRGTNPLDPAIVAATIIDRQADADHQGRVFFFNSLESPDTIVAGLTIRSGYSNMGGAATCRNFSSPSFYNCVFTGHFTTSSGTVETRGWSTPLFANCVFADNMAYKGGAVYATKSAPVFCNCLFINNAASLGSALYTYNANAVFDHCTVSANSTATSAAVQCLNTLDSALTTLRNCIIWNEPIALYGNPPEGFDVAFSLVQGGWPGAGNVDADPLFADPDGPDDDPATWQDNDFRLLPGSPGIDAGANAAVPPDVLDLDGDGDVVEPLPLDLAWAARFLDDAGTPDRGDAGDTGLPVTDLGAYEFQGQTCFGDLTGDFQINLVDLAQLLGHYGLTAIAQYRDGDLDADGDVDLRDLANLLSRYLDPCP